MTIYDFLQTKTYSTNTAATSHALTLDSNVVTPGGSTCPSALVATLSYDGASGDQCSSITDTDGNTWARGASASNSSSINGEMWYAFNVVGGGTPTITANMASSVKMSMVVVEVDQVKPVSPLDQHLARIHTPVSNTTTRQSAAANSTKSVGMREVFIGGLAWNQAGFTTDGNYTGFTDTTTVQDGSSNIGAAITHRSAEQNITGTFAIGYFKMTPTSTYPAAAMSLTFFRAGVVTSTDEDGYIDNIEGTATAYTTPGPNLVYCSSQSAPLGGTGGSERSAAYSFFPQYDGLPDGATIGETIILNYGTDDGYDEGAGSWGIGLYTSKSGQGSPTLTTADEYVVNDHFGSLGTTPYQASAYLTVTLSKTADYNPSGYTSVMMTQEPLNQDAGPTGNYVYLKETDYGGYPMWLELAITYPAAATSTPLRTLMGVGV
jgi:hypothetical protein